MNKKNWYLGAAVLGVLLSVGLGGNAFARALGRMYGNSLHIENEPRANTAGRFTLGNDDAYIKGKLEVDGSIFLDGQHFSIVPSTQALAAGFTITADACGGLKRVSATLTDLTSDTSNTITAPAAANVGCRMLIVNVGSTTIYLDSNSLFGVTSASALPIGPKGSISVWSDGTVWWHGSWTEY